MATPIPYHSYVYKVTATCREPWGEECVRKVVFFIKAECFKEHFVEEVVRVNWTFFPDHSNKRYTQMFNHRIIRLAYFGLGPETIRNICGNKAIDFFLPKPDLKTVWQTEVTYMPSIKDLPVSLNAKVKPSLPDHKNPNIQRSW